MAHSSPFPTAYPHPYLPSHSPLLSFPPSSNPTHVYVRILFFALADLCVSSFFGSIGGKRRVRKKNLGKQKKSKKGYHQPFVLQKNVSPSDARRINGNWRTNKTGRTSEQTKVGRNPGCRRRRRMPGARRCPACSLPPLGKGSWAPARPPTRPPACALPCLAAGSALLNRHLAPPRPALALALARSLTD